VCTRRPDAASRGGICRMCSIGEIEELMNSGIEANASPSRVTSRRKNAEMVELRGNGRKEKNRNTVNH